MKFKIEDRVKWDIANYNDRYKTPCISGKIIFVAPPEKFLLDVLDDRFVGFSWGARSEIFPDHKICFTRRWSPKHESYIVEIAGEGRGKPRVYWPVVSRLRMF